MCALLGVLLSINTCYIRACLGRSWALSSLSPAMKSGHSAALLLQAC